MPYTPPKQDDKSTFKMKLIVGKTVQIDKSNKYLFNSKIEKEIIQGWRFTRYIDSKLGPIASTLIAINPNEPKVKRFIMLGGEPYFIRYNSNFPMVVYAPKGVDARYRIWSTGFLLNINDLGGSTNELMGS